MSSSKGVIGRKGLARVPLADPSYLASTSPVSHDAAAVPGRECS